MSDADLNPYEAPLADSVPEPEPTDDDGVEGMDEGGVWRDANLLVVRKGELLPQRCVKCNEPAERMKKQTLYWHHPGLYFLLLSPLIYLIVIVIVRQNISLSVGVCHRHLVRRNRTVLIAWLLVLGGLVLMTLSACLLAPLRRDFSLLLLLSGIATIIGGVFLWVLGPRLLWPKRIDSYFAWIHGASGEYLAELPEVPGPSVPSFPTR